MSSERRIEANRRNAARSTGPRTTKGKQRASGNAYKHGWSVNIRHISDMSDKIEALAIAIAGYKAKPHHLQVAREVGEARFHLRRLQECKLSLLEVDDARLRTIGSIIADCTGEGDDTTQMSQDAVQYDPDIEAKLAAIGRYEQRAQSKLWRSMIKFQAAKDEDDEALR